MLEINEKNIEDTNKTVLLFPKVNFQKSFNKISKSYDEFIST